MVKNTFSVIAICSFTMSVITIPFQEFHNSRKEIAKEQVSEQLEAIIEEAELPEVVTEQQARVPKTLEDSDPGFVEAREESSLAEPNIPVPRAASRQHYYQHQYQDKHSKWYYARHGF